jgi:hypothetical protein
MSISQQKETNPPERSSHTYARAAGDKQAGRLLNPLFKGMFPHQ